MTEINSTSPNKDDWPQAIFIWVFLLIWLSGMVSGFSAGGCEKERLSPNKRLVYCNVSISIAAVHPFNLGHREKQKGSKLFAERGIVHSMLGHNTKAIGDFKRAWYNAADLGNGNFGPNSARRTIWQERILDRIRREKEGSAARMLFRSAMSELD